MAGRNDAIYARAVLDFDEQHSIKQVKNIAKHAEKILKDISKTGKNPLQPLDGGLGVVYGNLVKSGKKYYEMIFKKVAGELKFDEKASGIASESRMKTEYGADLSELEKLVSAYSKLYEKADAFNSLVQEIKNNVKEGKTVGLSEISNALLSYEKVYAELSKSGLDTSEIDSNAQYLEDYENNYKSISQRLADIINSTLTPTERLHLQLKNLRTQLAEAEQSFLALGIAGESTKEAEDNIVRLRKEITKMERGLKLTPFQKLLNTIKRVGFYRVARNLFKIIEHGFMDGINDLIAFDKRADSAFSSIARSFEIIRSSIALMVLPLTEMVAPKFEDIAYAVADFAEGVSKASSALNGMTKYTKINRDYMKSLRDEANKTALSFDKFQSLNAKDDIYETGEMTPEEMELATQSTEAQALKVLEDVLNVVWELIKSIGGAISKIWKAIEPDLDKILEIFSTFIGIVADAIIWVAQLMTKFYDWASKNGILEGSIKLLVIAIAGLKLVDLASKIGKIGSMITNTTKSLGGLHNAILGIAAIGIIFAVEDFFDVILKDAPRAVKVITGVVSALLAVAGAMWAIKSGGNPFALGLFAVSAGAMLASISSLTKEIPQYANGGIVDSGSLFIAGEAGAELITTMPSGKTGVTNIAQFKQAMVEAIYECADVFQQADGSVALYLDGAQIARSKSFKNELNRTNAGLNLR